MRAKANVSLSPSPIKLVNRGAKRKLCTLKKSAETSAGHTLHFALLVSESIHTEPPLTTNSRNSSDCCHKLRGRPHERNNTVHIKQCMIPW